MGVVTETEAEVMRSLNGAEGPVSSLLFQGFKTYESVKGKAFESKRFAGTVGPVVDFAENTFSKATKMSPLKVERVVEVLDSSVDSAIKYGKDTKESVVTTASTVSARPIKLKNDTLSAVHTHLEKYIDESRLEEGEEKVATISPGEMGIKIIFDDVSLLSSQRAQKILDVSETYVDKYLHEEDEEDELDVSVEEKAKSAAARAFVLSKVVSKRMQKRALAGLTSLKLRTQEVVHIDLMKYSQMLDSGRHQIGVAYDYSKAYVMTTFENRVAVPARKVSNEIGVKADEAKVVAEKYGKQVADRVVAIKVPFTEKDVLYYLTTASETADKRIVKPLEEIVETFKKDLEVETKKQDPEKPLTIEAGFRALISASRYRASIILASARNYYGAKHDTSEEVHSEETEEETE